MADDILGMEAETGSDGAYVRAGFEKVVCDCVVR